MESDSKSCRRRDRRGGQPQVRRYYGNCLSCWTFQLIFSGLLSMAGLVMTLTFFSSKFMTQDGHYWENFAKKGVVFVPGALLIAVGLMFAIYALWHRYEHEFGTKDDCVLLALLSVFFLVELCLNISIINSVHYMYTFHRSNLIFKLHNFTNITFLHVTFTCKARAITRCYNQYRDIIPLYCKAYYYHYSVAYLINVNQTLFYV